MATRSDQNRAAREFLRHAAIACASLWESPDNQTSYGSDEAVQEYGKGGDLFPAERVIRERLETWLSGKRMLDVGVGGGRTTPHFAPLVDSYVGVDYSSTLIEVCKRQVAGTSSNVSMAVADVRDLRRFGSGSFDFVLFSFNGIDSISHVDRVGALGELHRVCSSTGLLCFSSHNICAVDRLFDWRERSHGPAAARMRELIWQGALRLLNPSLQEMQRQPYAAIRDGCLQFRVRNLYVRPSEQIRQLRVAGFKDVEAYGFGGQPIPLDQIDHARSIFLYYLAAPDPWVLQTV